MHMADALLSPAVGAAFWAGTAATIAWCSKKLRELPDEKMIPLMGVIGAFIFAAQMINFTIPATGSSGHLGGGMILAILLGPHAAFLVMASVLTVQALFFADGGLLALGCNIWNLGLYPCFIAYPLIYKPLTRNSPGNGRILLAALLSAVIGLQIGAISVVIQTLLSGKSELPFMTFLLLMQLIHLAIGLAEGFVTAGVIGYVRTVRPEILESITSAQPVSAGVPPRKLFIGFLLAALLAGGVLSWFASVNPDGLEWSIERTFGKPELKGEEGGLVSSLESVQDRTAFLPGYNVRKPERTQGNTETSKSGQSWPHVDQGRSLSGLLGSLMVLVSVFVLGVSIKILRKKTLEKRGQP